jgi:hypothetical protein
MEKSEIVERLLEIRDEVSTLVNEAADMLQHTNAYSRADAYWLAQMQAALGNSGREMCTIVDTIDALSPHVCSHCGHTYEFDYCERETCY